MFVTGRDPLGMSNIPFRIEVQCSKISAMIAAYSKDIILPGVTLVGREYSAEAPTPVISEDGVTLTQEIREKIAKERTVKILEDGTKDYRSGQIHANAFKAAEDYLPKSFRVLKAKELATPEGETPKEAK